MSGQYCYSYCSYTNVLQSSKYCFNYCCGSESSKYCCSSRSLQIDDADNTNNVSSCFSLSRTVWVIPVSVFCSFSFIFIICCTLGILKYKKSRAAQVHNGASFAISTNQTMSTSHGATAPPPPYPGFSPPEPGGYTGSGFAQPQTGFGNYSQPQDYSSPAYPPTSTMYPPVTANPAYPPPVYPPPARY